MNMRNRNCAMQTDLFYVISDLIVQSSSMNIRNRNCTMQTDLFHVISNLIVQWAWKTEIVQCKQTYFT